MDGQPRGATVLLGPRRAPTPQLPRLQRRTGRATAHPPVLTAGGTRTVSATTARFRSPLLLLVAAAAIYLGYCELGVIATAGARWAWAVTAGPALIIEGALLAAGAFALSRPVAGRRLPGRTAMGSSGIAVAAAAALAVATGWRSAHDLLGMTELVVAATAIGVVVALERRHRRPADAGIGDGPEGR